MRNTTPKTSPAFREPLEIRDERTALHMDNLARVTATLLAAVMALLTFLLVTSVQNVIKGFTGPLYAVFIVLGASLVLYAVGNIIREYYLGTAAKSLNSKKDVKLQKKQSTASKLLQATRLLQQLVFIAGIGTLVWFAITFSELLVNPAPVEQPASSQQGTPSQSAGGAAPGQTETAEQHAAEQQNMSQ